MKKYFFKNIVKNFFNKILDEYMKIQGASPLVILPKPIGFTPNDVDAENKRKAKNIKLKALLDFTENLRLINNFPIEIKLERVIERDAFQPVKAKPKIDDLLKSKLKTQKFFVNKNIEKILSLASVHKSRLFTTEMRKQDKLSFKVKLEPFNEDHFSQMSSGVLISRYIDCYIDLQDML